MAADFTERKKQSHRQAKLNQKYAGAMCAQLTIKRVCGVSLSVQSCVCLVCLYDVVSL